MYTDTTKTDINFWYINPLYFHTLSIANLQEQCYTVFIRGWKAPNQEKPWKG